MDTGERTAKREQQSRSSQNPSEQPERQISDERYESTIDPKTVEKFRDFEGNTITETGEVISTILAEYDDGATPDSVEESVVSAVATEQDIGGEEARSRLVASTRPVLEREYSGTHGFILVELPDGSIFVDRIFYPETTDRETPEVRRHLAFVEQYGSLDTLPQLRGEQVRIRYDPDESRWKIAAMEDDRTRQTGWFDGSRVVFDSLSHVLTASLLAIGLVATLSTATTAVAGNIRPRTFLFAVLCIICTAYVSDILRTSVRFAGRVRDS